MVALDCYRSTNCLLNMIFFSDKCITYTFVIRIWCGVFNYLFLYSLFNYSFLSIDKARVYVLDFNIRFNFNKFSISMILPHSLIVALTHKKNLYINGNSFESCSKIKGNSMSVIVFIFKCKLWKVLRSGR